MEIPVDVIAVGDRSLWLERKAASEQTIANRRRQISGSQVGTIGPASAGKEQHAKSIGRSVSVRKRRQIPRFAERLSIGRGQCETVRLTGAQTSCAKLPALAGGVGHLATNRRGSHAKRGCRGHRTSERRFDENLAVAHGWQQMPELPGVP